jgi:membrane protease subunit HflK
MSEPDLNLPKPPQATPPSPTPEPPDADDAGTQALSEALRSSFFIIQIIMGVLVLGFLASGFFTVKEQNKAIVLRMGRPVGQGQDVLLPPGAHFAFPAPIDEVTNVPFTSLQQAQSSVGWYKKGNEPDPTPGQSIDPSTSVSYVLTADTNIVHVRGTVTYRITKPITFYFEFADAAGLVTNDLNSALLLAASRFTVDDIVSKQQTVFRETVEARMRELVEQQGLGITVDSVTYEAKPPLALAADFDKVVKAVDEHDTAVSQSITYSNQVVGNALGEKDARIKAATARTSRMVSLVEAEKTNFTRLAVYYRSNPEQVSSLLRTELFKKVWTTNTQSTFVLPGVISQMRIHLGEPIAPLNLNTN